MVNRRELLLGIGATSVAIFVKPANARRRRRRRRTNRRNRTGVIRSREPVVSLITEPDPGDRLTSGEMYTGEAQPDFIPLAVYFKLFEAGEGVPDHPLNADYSGLDEMVVQAEHIGGNVWEADYTVNIPDGMEHKFICWALRSDGCFVDDEVLIDVVAAGPCQ